MLTWIAFPNGRRITGDFDGTLRPGTIITIDAVEYVVENIGQIAAEYLQRSRRLGTPRRFVPIVYLKTRASSERPATQPGGADAHRYVSSVEAEHAANHQHRRFA
jgi:hypothetical protein